MGKAKKINVIEQNWKMCKQNKIVFKIEIMFLMLAKYYKPGILNPTITLRWYPTS